MGKVSFLMSLLWLFCFDNVKNKNNIHSSYVAGAITNCQCNYGQCGASVSCCPGLTCVFSSPSYSQCLETTNNTKGSKNNCIATLSGFGCTKDSDCCNPSTKCMNSFCNFPCATTPSSQPTQVSYKPGFSPFSTFNTSQINTGQYYYVAYLNRWNISCHNLGLNSFHLQYKYQSVTVNYGYYTIKCVSPGFNATQSSFMSNIKPIQGGVVPVANIKYFQYLTPSIADCSSVGGAITHLTWMNTNNNNNGGYSYTCCVFGSFHLSQCRTVTNAPTGIGDASYATGNMNFLDRQYVSCNSNEALQSIMWTYNGDVIMSGQYVYTCCQYIASCPTNSYYSKGVCYLNPSSSPINLPLSTAAPVISSPSATSSATPSMSPLRVPSSSSPTTAPATAPAIALGPTPSSTHLISTPTGLPSTAPSQSLIIGDTTSSPTSAIADTINSGGNTSSTFTHSLSFIIIVVIGSFICLLLLVSLYILHMRWSLQNHSAQLWNWVANDLGGEVMVMIRGSGRLIRKDHVYSIRTVPVPNTAANTYFPGINSDNNSQRKSFKSVEITRLSSADKTVAQPIIHEGFL